MGFEKAKSEPSEVFTIYTKLLNHFKFSTSDVSVEASRQLVPI